MKIDDLLNIIILRVIPSKVSQFGITLGMIRFSFSLETSLSWCSKIVVINKSKGSGKEIWRGK